MNRESLQLPSTRSWRDIPQPAVPRAMSKEGRWRLTMAIVRGSCVALACVGVLWGAWLVTVSLHGATGLFAAEAKPAPLKAVELRTDGVLDNAWVVRTLALPKNATLLQLDLEKLRARLLADSQIASATVTRNFPDRLIVQVSERTPIARVTVEAAGERHVLLVARDGIAYEGTGYDPALLATLPWLDGVKIVPTARGFEPIAGMETAAELLAKARLEADHLYATWEIVSLARLQTDHQIEVRTKTGPCTIRFNARDDFFRQLIKLNYVWEQLSRLPEPKATIDLSLGQDVPVMVDPMPGEPINTAPSLQGRDGRPSRPIQTANFDGRTRGPRVPTSQTSAPTLSGTAETARALFVFPHPQPNQNKREL